MQNIILKIGFLIGGMIWFNSSIYNVHITTLNGRDKPMEDFRGKKILVVIIPVTKSAEDSGFLRRIDTVSKNYAPEIAVIAVPSFEDGYVPINLNDLQTYYRSILGNRVTITQGMYTKKGSVGKQHDLFYWLTHKEYNTHFDEDVSGVGQKFFVSEQGELRGVISPKAKLSDKLMQRMVQRHQ